MFTATVMVILSWNGKNLLEFYNTRECAEALIALGDLSAVAENLEEAPAELK